MIRSGLPEVIFKSLWGTSFNASWELYFDAYFAILEGPSIQSGLVCPTDTIAASILSHHCYIEPVNHVDTEALIAG